jgi:hypothetical protein
VCYCGPVSWPRLTVQTALQKARDLVIRESVRSLPFPGSTATDHSAKWVALMEARLVRDELAKCWRQEGFADLSTLSRFLNPWNSVNHYENCADLSQRYLGMIRDNRVTALDSFRSGGRLTRMRYRCRVQGSWTFHSRPIVVQWSTVTSSFMQECFPTAREPPDRICGSFPSEIDVFLCIHHGRDSRGAAPGAGRLSSDPSHPCRAFARLYCPFGSGFPDWLLCHPSRPRQAYR